MKTTYSLVNTVQAIRAMEVVCLQRLVSQGVFGADRHKRLGCLQGREALRPAGLPTPLHLLL